MKYLECMICWTPTDWPRGPAGQIEVGPWPDRQGWSRDYRVSVGACFADRHRMTEEARFIEMMCEFRHAVVMHKIDPQAAHREFSKIDEYREVFVDGRWA